jgi:hypothetical protein
VSSRWWYGYKLYVALFGPKQMVRGPFSVPDLDRTKLNYLYLLLDVAEDDDDDDSIRQHFTQLTDCKRLAIGR